MRAATSSAVPSSVSARSPRFVAGIHLARPGAIAYTASPCSSATGHARTSAASRAAMTASRGEDRDGGEPQRRHGDRLQPSRGAQPSRSASASGGRESERNERPRERRLLLPGSLRERRRLDDRRTAPEDAPEIRDVGGGGAEADDPDRHPVMLGDGAHRGERGEIVGIVVEVADQHHRRPRPLRHGDVDCHLHARGDVRAARERAPPGVEGNDRSRARCCCGSVK